MSNEKVVEGTVVGWGKNSMAVKLDRPMEEGAVIYVRGPWECPADSADEQAHPLSVTHQNGD